MYYLICFLLYFLIIFLLLYVLKRISKVKNKKKSKKFKDVFIKELSKGLTKSDLKYRKRRVKVLPLWQRFLYKLWFSSMVIIIVIQPVLFCIARNLVIGNFFVSKDALYYSSSSLSELVFGIGAFMCGMPILVGYSYISNRGVIRKADLLYQMGSFQEYPVQENLFISILLLIIGLPMMIMSFNSYTYIERDEFAIKTAFSISEKHYYYSDLDYIERKTYSNDRVNYIAHIKNKKKYIIHDSYFADLEFELLLRRNAVHIRDNSVKPLIE